jgi:hypothetical protein
MWVPMQNDDPHLTVFERVLCLECGANYSKPASGGTTSENPGCPRCGYVGWIAVKGHGRHRDAPPLRETG